ncbi:MAG TPA: bifunctional aconitate hydratase 2/2-methylisocitrate dehydratase [Anaeromyxobacter sp.]|nr:bifunctional aconitate hydratase 2/2-methylisocitrate dehydratase [Anaeromyxobacter sp.]
MLEAYRKHAAERAALGIPPRPLDAEQTEAVCALLERPPAGEEEALLALLRDRVPPGVDPAAEVKAAFLGAVARGARRSPLLSPVAAVELLGTMMGGHDVPPLLELLDDPVLADAAARALARTIYVHEGAERVVERARTSPAARRVLESWAAAEWFTARPPLPAELRVTVFKVDGEINTDDLSPAGDAATRPDIPLHALAMGKARFPGGVARIAALRAAGAAVAFAGDVIGTGSSRKSACNSVLWHIGEDVPFVPNKRRGGVIVGGAVAPIFFNTAQDSGALPIRADVTRLETGDVVVVDTVRGELRSADAGARGEVLARFALEPVTLRDEYRAGGRVPLIVGRALTARARAALGLPPSELFARPQNPAPAPGQGYTLAQKMVGKACGLPGGLGVLPGGAYEPRLATVGSQDTTGPMTADELSELACLRFQAPLVLQSFCHTAAYPKPADVEMQKALPGFVRSRGGVSLRPGDGVIHSWLNRMLLPDTVGTGGDSHTRFPIGISFPAGSGLVAFGAALGFMPLDMPESVRVRFRGRLRPGITLRDVVNAIPWVAAREGLLTVPKKNKKNVFAGRILELEGLPDLTTDQAFELADASAERSAAAATVALSVESVVRHVRSGAALLRRLVEEGYGDRDALLRRIEAMEAWLAKPELLAADANARYAAELEIDLDGLAEPLLACPNDPDDVRPLSEVQGTRIDDVFLGSCMTHVGHFRAAGEVWKGQARNGAVRTWLCPPTRMDQDQLKEEAYFPAFALAGARIELPGCSLCMGNQARVPDGATVFSTSTRNFDDRMGTGAKVFLGSAELGAVAAGLGRLPSPEEYLAAFQARIGSRAQELYRPLAFDVA